MRRTVASSILALLTVGVTALPALATPVCTDGYMGGPPRELCGGRVFPEAELTRENVQYTPDPVTGFSEYRHGLEYLAELYPRWVSVTTLSEHFGTDEAVSVGWDGIRSYEEGDTGDGFEILVVKVTDHDVPDEGKQTLLFSLSVHGDEKGGVEGGVRTIEDLADAAENGGTITDGIEGYPSATGIEPEFHEYEVADVLAQEAVYFIDFNMDGFNAGEVGAAHRGGIPGLYTRGNALGTDLNRQMPTVGRINTSRNPLEESEMEYGLKFMEEVAAKGVGGLMAYGADVHGESQSRAFADIMYPAGQFDSVKHRQLMAIAERTKSVIDATLYEGLVNVIEEQTGGDTGEGLEDYGFVPNTVPTKPARWGTVWDTLGYTDTGFIGDYLAAELGVTGMDYEIALNHSDTRAFGRPWSVLLQENWINATRSIVKTAMAYALYQDQEFADFTIDPKGRVAYLNNPAIVTDADGVGRPPGPRGDFVSQNGEIIEQAPYAATQMRFFEDTGEYVVGGMTPLAAADIAGDPATLADFDTLVIADEWQVEDALGRAYDPADLSANLRSWVEAGGNLVLTDRGLHLLAEMGVVDAPAVRDIRVYQPYANIVDREHPMVEGLRGNARQLAEFTVIGYGIGNGASPMTIVSTSAWEAAGGTVVGTTGNGSGSSDDGSQTSVGELPLGDGVVRIVGGALHQPEENESDHRFGLKDYGITYSALYILENSIVHDAPGLGLEGAQVQAAGSEVRAAPLPVTGGGLGLGLTGLVGMLALGLGRRCRAA